MKQMPQKEQEILDDVKFFEEKYFTFDAPISVGEFSLYPVKVKDYTDFICSCSCLTLNKNDDPEGISKTHLEYLLYKMQDKEQGVVWTNRFNKIVELCFHVDNGFFCPSCGRTMTFEKYFLKLQKDPPANGDLSKLLTCECGSTMSTVLGYGVDEKTKRYFFTIKNHKLDNDMFSKIRKYIMYQNLPDFKDDSWVNFEVRKDQALRSEIASRGSGEASLERKIVGLMACTSYKLDEVLEMSCRKFVQLLNMVDDIINYTTLKIGINSGFVSLKKGTALEHWLYKKKDDSLYQKAVSSEEYSSQIKNA